MTMTTPRLLQSRVESKKVKSGSWVLRPGLSSVVPAEAKKKHYYYHVVFSYYIDHVVWSRLRSGPKLEYKKSFISLQNISSIGYMGVLRSFHPLGPYICMEKKSQERENGRQSIKPQ